MIDRDYCSCKKKVISYAESAAPSPIFHSGIPLANRQKRFGIDSKGGFAAREDGPMKQFES
jgi:hypothetical protein